MLRVVLALSLAVPVLAQPQGYDVVVVGPSSSPPLINNAGVVVGRAPTGTYWWENTQTGQRGLGPALYDNGITGINSRGDLVGWARTTSAARSVGFVWKRDLGKDWWSLGENIRPVGVNDDGVVLGGGATGAFVWHESIGMLDLATLIGAPAGANLIPRAVSRNWIVGWALNVSPASFAWSPATGYVPGGGGVDVNDRGQSVGSDTIWDPVNGRRSLGALPGTTTRAFAINNRGQVVGVSEDAAGQRRAFLWENGNMVDISALRAPGTVPMGEAFDINDLGWIVGLDGIYGGVALLFIPRP